MHPDILCIYLHQHILLLVAFEFLGIKENRVEEVAAVATQVVINPTPVITCPATNAEVEVALLKMQMPPIIVMMAAR